MPSIEDDILAGFLDRLSSLDEIDEVMLTELRELLSEVKTKKIKADQFVDVFVRKSQGEVR